MSCSKLESPDIAQEFRISVEPLLNKDGQRDWEMRSKDGCSMVSFTVVHPYTVKITAFQCAVHFFYRVKFIDFCSTVVNI
jgi:hypothetical protein